MKRSEHNQKWTAKGHVSIYLSREEEERCQSRAASMMFYKENLAKRLPAAEALEFCREWVRNHVNRAGMMRRIFP